MKETKEYIPRFLEEKIKKYLPKKEFIAVVGPRQSGKTTMLRNIFKYLKNALFIDFEDREKLALFDNDLKSFVELYVKGYDYLFIDEFQYSKEGGKNLKFIFDNYETKVIISGSSISELSIQSIKYLVGRILIFSLYPFSFSEFLQFKDRKIFDIYNKTSKLSEQIISRINEFYREYVIYGGYPRVIISESLEEKKTILRNIYNTYLLKEVKEILGIKEDYKISKLMHGLALQIGGLVDYGGLCSLVGCPYNELISNLNILKKTFIINESRPFYTNKRTELVKNPKIFFFDNGFRNFIINNFQELRNRTDKGQLNENFVSSEIAKNDINLQYWRSKSKAEIDFVIEKEGRIIPIEVKSDLYKPNLNKAAYSFCRKYKSKEIFILSERLFDKKKFDFGIAKFMPLFYAGKIVEDFA